MKKIQSKWLSRLIVLTVSCAVWWGLSVLAPTDVGGYSVESPDGKWDAVAVNTTLDPSDNPQYRFSISKNNGEHKELLLDWVAVMGEPVNFRKVAREELIQWAEDSTSVSYHVNGEVVHTQRIADMPSAKLAE